MSIFKGFTDLMSDLGNVIQGVWNDWTGNTATRENIAYQQDFNQQVFNRADTQYQRTVADLRAAGLSSQLAAGAPSTVAGASQAPSRTVGNESAAIEKLVGLVNSIKQTKASVNLTNAQADKVKTEDAIAQKQLAGFDEYRQYELASMGSSTALNNAYTQLAMTDGQTRAIRNMAEIQNWMAQSSHNLALTRLVEKQIDLTGSEISLNRAKENLTVSEIDLNRAKENYTHAQTANEQKGFQLLNKQIDLLGEQIVTERFKQENLDSDTYYTLKQAAVSSLKYVMDSATFKFNIEKGDSAYADQVSSSESREARLAWKRQMISSLVSGLTSSVVSVATGVGMGFGMTFGRGAGSKFFNKMLGMDHESTFGFH